MFRNHQPLVEMSNPNPNTDARRVSGSFPDPTPYYHVPPMSWSLGYGGSNSRLPSSVAHPLCHANPLTALLLGQQLSVHASYTDIEPRRLVNRPPLHLDRESRIIAWVQQGQSLLPSTEWDGDVANVLNQLSLFLLLSLFISQRERADRKIVSRRGNLRLSLSMAPTRGRCAVNMYGTLGEILSCASSRLLRGLEVEWSPKFTLAIGRHGRLIPMLGLPMTTYLNRRMCGSGSWTS
jgi:hypothetical protein